MFEQVLRKDFTDMIKLFAKAATGQPLESVESLDIAKALKTASVHGVWELAFSTVDQKCQEDQDICNNIPGMSYHEMLNAFFTGSVDQMRRQHALYTLFDKFDEERIKYCILKGESLSHVYYTPQLRVCEDTDIYIFEDYINSAVEILKKFGYEIKEPQERMHRLNAEHRIAGIVSLHLKLFDDFGSEYDSSHMIFSENCRLVRGSEGRMLSTLGVTDALIYTFLNLTGHFITGGIGIRPVMDIVLYTVYYNSEIDWDRFYSLIKDLKYDFFFDQIIGIGIYYFSLDRDILPRTECDLRCINQIMLDIQAYGDMQKKKKDANGSGMPKTRKKRKLKKYDHKLFFPGLDELEDRFVYLKKSVMLYPIVLLHRPVYCLYLLISGQKSIYSYLFDEDSIDTKDDIFDRSELIRNLRIV